MASRAAEALRTGSSSAELAEAGSVQVLTTLIGNLVQSPSEEKFRKVKLSNAKINKALSRPGAEDLLFSVGFAKNGDLLEIPGSCAAEDVKAAAQAALDALSSQCGSFVLSAQLHAEGAVRSVCAVPPGQLATGAMDNLVRLYRLGEWDSPKLLFGHEKRGGVSGVLALTPLAEEAGGDLASAGRDGKIILWQGGAERAKIAGHGEGVTGTNVHVVSCLGRRADGTLLSGGWDKTVRAWQGNAEISKFEGHEIAVNAVVGLPNGDVASGSGDQTIGIWHGSEKVRSLAARAPVRALCSCGGNLLASGANDGVVRLWDVATGQQLAERKVSDAYVLSLACCASTGGLAAGADDGTLAILAVEGSSLHIVETLQLCGEVYGLAFLESGDLAAACGDDSCVVWTRNPRRAAGMGLREDYAAKVRAMAAAKAAAAGGGAATGGGGGTHDFSVPVELGGNKMTLNWNRGEEAQTVAKRFVEANGLDPRHMSDVVAFVAHAQQQAVTGGGGGGAAPGGTSGSYDFNYPVEVADGRRLTISWNRGDDPQEVALAFARRNGGIAANELPDIVNFIAQVSGGPAPVAMQQAPPAPAVPPAMQQQAMQQVMEMGFDEGSARNALQATGWSVEMAIQRLLG